MIFVTIGTQEPFDRMIKAIDKIAPALHDSEIVAQVSKSQYQPKHLQTYQFLAPTEFNDFFMKADLIVSHAGMGTIISALVHEKPILILPRLAKFSEHRNDHQLATAKAFEKLKYVNVAYNEAELESKLLSLAGGELKSLYKIGNCASQSLLSSIQKDIRA